MKCKICKENAQIHLKYCGLKLCITHFLEYLQKRVKRTIKRYKMVKKNDKIAVALSGGKDSQSLIHILKQIYPENNSIIAIHISLGIEKYSNESLKPIKIICDNLNIPLHVIELKKEYNFTIDDIQSNNKIKRAICANCGLVKRYCMNFFARELNADVLATGHLLDDEVSILLSNLVNGNIDLLSRNGPYLPSTDSTIVARAKPLYETSEFETALYAQLTDIPFVHKPCPHDEHATVSAFKQLTKKMEEMNPGSRYNLLRNYLKFYRQAFREIQTDENLEILHCQICGGPTIKDTCAFCRLRSKVGVL